MTAVALPHTGPVARAEQPAGDELRARAYLHQLGARPVGHTLDSPRRTRMTTPAPDQEPRWWSVGKDRADEPPSQGETTPGVHVHITPTAPPPQPTSTPGADRQTRSRRWLAIHGAAAGTGWTVGLYDSMAAFLNTVGRGAPAAGLALTAFGWIGAELITDRYSRILPRRLRPAALWVARIPMATALLATVLHAPNSLT